MLALLITVYIIGWIISAAFIGYVTHEEAGDLDLRGAIACGLSAMLWPLLILLIFPYIGAWFSARKG